MSTRQIEKENLKAYLDHFSMIMPAELVEIEVASLNIGDQIEAEWVPMSGISYDPKDDVVVVELDNGNVMHNIRQPVEFWLDEDDSGVRSFEVKCAEGHLHIIRLKEPKKLP